MNRIISNWNLFRVVRLLLGAMFVFEGIRSQEMTVIFFGGVFMLLPLFNVGCCGPSGCATPKHKIENPEKEVVYEEIK